MLVKVIKARKVVFPNEVVDAKRRLKKEKKEERRKIVRRVLDENNHDPTKQIPVAEICSRVVALAQVLGEKRFYPYQIELANRVVESLLLHDSEVITGLISRQAGKSTVIGDLVVAIAIIIPALARKFPDDWKLNITDEQGNYRGFARGIKIGIYAPRRMQAEILFNRAKDTLNTKSSKKVIKELNATVEVSNGNTLVFGDGSRVFCDSASEQSKIEGQTYHLLILEECQDISTEKVRKSLSPMLASTRGTRVEIGTPNNQKCAFYDSIKDNQRTELITGKRNHFYFPYQVCVKYNSQYRKYVEKEKARLGENSDEFRMSYEAIWIFERGMFITQDALFHPSVALTESAPHPLNFFSQLHPKGIKHTFPYFSIVVGLDWGAASDSTVLTLVAVDWLNPIESGTTHDVDGLHEYTFYRKHVIGWFEWLGDDYEKQYWEILDIVSQVPGISKIVTDSNGCGRPIYDRMVASLSNFNIEVEPFNFSFKVKSDGYKALAQELSGGRLTFPAAKEVRPTLSYRKFVTQMLDLKKDYKNGIMRVAAPDEKNAHDDFPSSLVLANWGAMKPSSAVGFETHSQNFFYR